MFFRKKNKRCRFTLVHDNYSSAVRHIIVPLRRTRYEFLTAQKEQCPISETALFYLLIFVGLTIEFTSYSAMP